MKTRPCTRSEQMRHIKSQDTSIELVLRKRLWHMGYRYRKNYKGLPGSPDIVLTKYKTVVFVNGCFWHHHDCGRFVWPSSNAEYWYNKINRNVERDTQNTTLLAEQGWQVLIIWECQLKKKVAEENLQLLYNKIIKNI